MSKTILLQTIYLGEVGTCEGNRKCLLRYHDLCEIIYWYRRRGVTTRRFVERVKGTLFSILWSMIQNILEWWPVTWYSVRVSSTFRWGNGGTQRSSSCYLRKRIQRRQSYIKINTTVHTLIKKSQLLEYNR